MARRWTAAAALEREQRFLRINGYRDLWLERALDRHTEEVTSSRTAAYGSGTAGSSTTSGALSIENRGSDDVSCSHFLRPPI